MEKGEPVNTTRDRILEAGASLFRQRGFHGAGIKQIADAARAPMGSLYHFFAGGKDQLGEEVIRASGPFYIDLLDHVWDDTVDPAEGTRRFFYGAAQTLRDTDYADACPIAVIALEVASTHEGLRQATADVFATWIAAIETRFTAAGRSQEAAKRCATFVLAALEGAFILSRSMRDATIVETTGDMAAAAVREAALAPDDLRLGPG